MRTGLLALIGVGLLFAAWVLNFVLPGSGIAVWAIVAVGAGFIAAAALWDLRRVRGALASRRGIIGIGASVSLSLAIGTVVLANLVSSTLFHRFDFTGLQQFTLTTQTKEVLAELDSEVEVVSFFAEPNPNMENSAEIAAVNSFGFELLKEYETYTDRLRIRREDPELRPDLARQYGVNPFGAAVGTVVFRGEFGQMNVYGPQIQGEAESAFTSALLQVTGTRQRVIYFLTGHGEGSILGEYESARRGLRDNLFQIGELNLDQVDDIPPNANVVIVAGPQAPYAPDEIELLGRYLRAGGRLALLLNPNPQQEFRDFAGDWWLTIEEGILVDPPAHVAPNVDVPLVDRARNAYGLREGVFPRRGGDLAGRRGAGRGKAGAAGLDQQGKLGGALPPGGPRPRSSTLTPTPGGRWRWRWRCSAPRLPMRKSRCARTPAGWCWSAIPTSPPTSTSATATTAPCS